MHGDGRHAQRVAVTGVGHDDARAPAVEALPQDATE
jgi:hypothetical protein